MRKSPPDIARMHYLTVLAEILHSLSSLKPHRPGLYEPAEYPAR